MGSGAGQVAQVLYSSYTPAGVSWSLPWFIALLPSLITQHDSLTLYTVTVTVKFTVTVLCWLAFKNQRN